MRWLTFGIFAFVMLALELGVHPLWNIGGHTPSLMLILAVYVALAVPFSISAPAALIVGLLVDLTYPVSVDGQGDFALVGPACLGYLLGTRMSVELRGLVFRESPVAFAFMVLVVGIFVNLIIVALITLRGLPWLPADPVRGWEPADELVGRFFELLYSAALAVPLGFVLVWTDRLWGFDHGGSGRRARAMRDEGRVGRRSGKSAGRAAGR